MHGVLNSTGASSANFELVAREKEVSGIPKIEPAHIATFAVLFGIALLAGLASARWTLGRLPLGDFRGVVLTGAGVFFFYLWAFFVYRMFLRLVPLKEGPVEPGSRGAWAAQVNILFYLILFNTLVRTQFVPVPLMRLVYKALGAKMGANTYSPGCILDPPLTELGDHCMIGHGAVLFAHAIEGSRFSLSRIRIGHRVTVGAMSVIMSGVTISDGAIVAAGAVVVKNTRIGANEIWGGAPAKKIRTLKPGDRAYVGSPQTNPVWLGEKKLEIARGV